MRHRRRTALLTSLLAMVVVACEDDFDPVAYLDDLRIIAAYATPPETGRDEVVALTAVVFGPGAEHAGDGRWSFCPFTKGSATGYECVLPACEATVTPAAPGAPQHADLNALLTPCLLELARLAARDCGAGLPRGVPTNAGDLPETIEVVFRYVLDSVPDPDSGEVLTREAVVRVPFWTGGVPADAARNRHPELRSLSVGGVEIPVDAVPRELTAVPGEGALEITVGVREDSLDSYTDEADRERTEEPVVRFYASGGKFDPETAVGTAVTTVWAVEDLGKPGATAELYVRVDDQRGGQVVAGPIRVTVSP